MDEQLLSLIAEYYDLTDVRAGSRLATSGRRQAWDLATGRGALVLKVTDPGRPEEVVASDTGILAHLAKAGFPAPRPVYNRAGGLYAPFGDRFFYLYERIEGQYPAVTPALYPRLGALLARLHSLPREDFDRPSLFRPPEIMAEVKQYLLTVVDDPTQGRMAAHLLERIDRFPSFRGLPLGLVHTDPYFVNLIEGAGGALHLIDWEDAGVGYPLLDAGYIGHLSTFLPHDCARWGVRQEGLVTWRAAWAQAFLDGYQSVRPLNSLERELFGPAVWMNFLAYIWEWDEGRIIPENFERMKLLEAFRPRW